MRGMLSTESAVLAELELVGGILFILRGRVVALLALCASQGNDVPHGDILQLPSRTSGKGDWADLITR